MGNLQDNEKKDLHFEISSHVVWQLGEELVTDEITAIMELIKNAYDADADWVKVSIHLDGTEDDRIEIEDNGTGMDYSTIERGWLFISLSSKREMKEQKLVTEKGRAPLGEKGLGRLSTQKLGYQLELRTGVINKTIEYHVSFDWKDFKEEIALADVKVYQEESPKAITKHGTVLTIRDLRSKEAWGEKGILAFRAQLSKLIYPIPEKRPFKVYLFKNRQQFDLDELNENIRKTAVGKFSFSFEQNKLSLIGSVKLSKLKRGKDGASSLEFQNKLTPDSGKDFFGFLTDSKRNKQNSLPYVKYIGKNEEFISFERSYDFMKLPEIKSTIDGNGNLVKANPGNFFGEIDDYDFTESEGLDSELRTKDSYKLFIKNQTGIRVFRDGFGIKPYGLGENDWLGLSKGQTSGGSFYGLRPGNTIGFVSISVYENADLIEKTDREGFQESPFSKNFELLLHQIIKDINSTYEGLRRSWIEYRKSIASEKGSIHHFTDSTNRIKETSQLAGSIEAPFKKLKEAFLKISSKTGEITTKVSNQPLFASEFENRLGPEIREVNSLLNESNGILNQLAKLLPLAQKLKHDAEYLEPQIQNLQEQILQFSELAGLGLTAEALTHELYQILDRINSQTESFHKKMKATVERNPEIFIYIEQVKTFLKNIRGQLNHLSPSLKFNRDQKHKINLGDFAKSLKEHFRTRFENQNIEFKIEISNDFSVIVNQGKLTQIFDNLLINSEYWLKERQKGNDGFRAIITMQIDKPSIRILDNGYGVDSSVEGQIFQPFITMKPRTVGRGLGLFISQQLVESFGSEIYLLQERNDHDRRFIFQINLESIMAK